MDARQREFDGLVRRYARLMAAAIRRVCGRRRGLIPDVEQEVYLALWKRLGSGNEIAHPASYLYKMALTTALAVVRDQEPDAAALPLEEAGERGERAAPREGGLEPAERRRLIQQVLAQVGAEEARALRAYLAGFNHAEVAGLYGWSESVARHRIYRSLERLRALAGREGTGRDERRAVGRA